MMDLPKRKQIRLKEFDYSRDGAYFVTICTKDRKEILGEIVGGGTLDATKMNLSPIGQIVEKYIESTERIKSVRVDKYVIMPNHIHLILVVDNNGTPRASSPTNETIPHVVSTLKRFVNRDVGENVFQRSFYDHVIRNEYDYKEIWEYIDTNPLKWKEDCFYKQKS